MRPLGLILLSLIFLFSFNMLSFAVEVSELEKYKGKEYGPEYFGAIRGEVYGQAAPGVQAVYVNEKRVQIDKNLYFETKVYLKKGQKYLTIDTRYKGLRFIKKYLVIRHPKAPKTFKIHVPKKEFQKIITKAERRVPRKKIVKKPKPKPKASFGFKTREFKGPYTAKTLSRAIKDDDYDVETTAPENSLKYINEILRTPNFYESWRTKDKNVVLTEEMKRLIKETNGYRNKPFTKLTRFQQLKIIRLNRLLLEATYPLLAPKSLPEGLMAEEDEKWLGFEFAAELERGKFLVVRRVNGKYFGTVLDTKTNIWLPLHEISLREFKDLLEKNQLPPSFNS